METDRKMLLFNGFGIISSLYILLGGQLFSHIIIYLLVQICGLLLILWAIVTIKANKKQQKHTLPKGYFFLTIGPYEIIRHPIYAGYLLIMISFVEIDFNFWRMIAFIILACVILLKIVREEHTLGQEVHEYKEYRAKTKAIIPYLL